MHGRIPPNPDGMRHLEPQQMQPRERRDRQRQPVRKPSLWKLAALIILLAGGAGFGLTFFFPPSAADRVTPQEADARLQDFARAPPLLLQSIPRDKADAVVSAMDMPAAQKDALRRDLGVATAPATAPLPAQAQAQVPAPAPAPAAQLAPNPGARQLVEVVLWDTHSPDGDVVRVRSAGFSRDVVLSRTPTVVFVPVDGSGALQIQGVHDGGGGITLGVRGPQNAMLMPVMSPGQVLNLGIRLR